MKKELPIVTSGLVLGLLSLGNLLSNYSNIYRYIFGLLGIYLFIWLNVSIIKNKSLKIQLNHPLVASVFTTYFMSGQIISGYILIFDKFGYWTLVLAKIIWWIFFCGNIIYMIYFTKKYIFNFKICHLYPSWSVLYVGILVSGLMINITGQFLIEKIIFYYGLIATIILLPVIFYRIYILKLREHEFPNITIICAAISLLLVDYMTVFDNKNIVFIKLLLTLSQLIYVFVLIQLPKLINRKFNPGFAAFTFPMVVSAMSLKLSSKIINLPVDIGYFANIETLIATIIVGYVFIKYIKFIIL